MALYSLTEGDYFCRLKMGRCFLNTTFYSCPFPAVELPVRMLSAPPLLSSLLWRPCSPPALGTVATDDEEMLEILYNRRCLATAANEPSRGSAPSVHLCWKLGYLCSSLQSAVWGCT